ncbi:MAG: LytR C-terminal domain-containing protein [Actinomycetota bacterium]|nr:LytR C-terminal domain-containing protein [Actinomycetota bacterium]
MGRHSSRNQLPFYRSVAGWLVPWAIIGAIVLGGVAVAVRSVSGPAGSGGPSLARADGRGHGGREPVAHGTQATAHETRVAAIPSSQPSVLSKLITNGVTVQVLNATDAPDAADRMANRLTRLGYRVFAIRRASILYDHTTVFWATAADRPAAEALASHFGWVSAPKPANLTADVSIHVVVGADEK